MRRLGWVASLSRTGGTVTDSAAAHAGRNDGVHKVWLNGEKVRRAKVHVSRALHTLAHAVHCRRTCRVRNAQYANTYSSSPHDTLCDRVRQHCWPEMAAAVSLSLQCRCTTGATSYTAPRRAASSSSSRSATSTAARRTSTGRCMINSSGALARGALPAFRSLISVRKTTSTPTLALQAEAAMSFSHF